MCDIIGEAYVICVGDWFGHVVDEETIEGWGEVRPLGHPCTQIEKLAHVAAQPNRRLPVVQVVAKGSKEAVMEAQRQKLVL